MANDVAITEFEDIEPESVHLVKRGANGFPALIAKGAADEVAAAAAGEDLAAEVVKADKYNTDDRNRMASSGEALPDGSYPIADKEDLSNAIQAVGRGGTDHNAIRKHIIDRAAALGTSDQIPPNWNKDGSLTAEADNGTAKQIFPTLAAGLAKDDGTDAGADLSQPDPLDAPDPDMTQTPGSAGWEAQDAANLIAAGQVLAQAQQIVQAAIGREQMEVATGHAEDMADVMDLSDALFAVQAALGIVARVAFQEEAESAAAKGEAVKAGKVLSGKNVGAIQAAIQALKDLLAAAGETDASDSGGDTDAATKEILDMQLTTEEFDARVAAAVTKAFEAQKAETEAAEAAKADSDDTDTKDCPTCDGTGKIRDGHVTCPDCDGSGKSSDDTAKAAASEEITKSVDEVRELVKGVSDTLTDITGRLETVEKMAQPVVAPAKTRAPEEIKKADERDLLEAQAQELERRALKQPDPYEAAGLRDRAANIRKQLADRA